MKMLFRVSSLRDPYNLFVQDLEFIIGKLSMACLHIYTGTSVISNGLILCPLFLEGRVLPGSCP